MQQGPEARTIRELPLKYMFGLKEVEQSVLIESNKLLFANSDEITGHILDSLTTVLNQVLEKSHYDDFDRAVVQLTARMVACSRAAYDSLRVGHLVSAIAMARDLLETYVTCHHLAADPLLSTQWISATTLNERRQFDFSRVVKSFDEDTSRALRDIYNLFSGDAHANHLTVSYVRFRKPMGVNYYLTGCNGPLFLANILDHCCSFSLHQLESLCDWYHELHGVSEVCPAKTLACLRSRLDLATAQLREDAKHEEEELVAAERADNLSPEELHLAESIRKLALSRNQP